MPRIETSPPFSLTEDIWRLISAQFNDQDIRFSIMLVSKQFKNFFSELGLLTRAPWYGVNYNEIAYSQTIPLPASITSYHPVCMGFPLHNADLAFGLTPSYDYIAKRSPYPKYRPTRLCEDWQDSYQAIVVFNTGMKTPVQLIGHQSGIRKVIQHNKSTLISIGKDNTLRIWDKFTGLSKRIISNFSNESVYIPFLNWRNKANRMLTSSPKGYINNPIYLLSLNNKEVACFNASGTAFVWNIETGQSTRELLNFESQRLKYDGLLQTNGCLIILHDDDTNEDYFSWQKYTIFDIKTEKIIKTIEINKIKPLLLDYLDTLYKTNPYFSENDKKKIHRVKTSEVIECIDYSHNIVVLERRRTSSLSQHKTTYFYDVENEKIIFGFPGCDLQYKFLKNGTLIILYHTTEGWHVLSDYCHETGDFKIKWSQIEDRNNQYEHFTNRSWHILNNGDILTYYWKLGFASLWCKSTNHYLSEFDLKIPSNLMTHTPSILCLPDGKILAYSYDGIIAIWDDKTGALLLNQKLTENSRNARFNCFHIFQNGDLYFTWCDNPSQGESLFPDTYSSALLRFNLFQNPSIKNTCDDLESYNYPKG